MRVMEKSVHIKTFGCQMNVYDSQRMLSLLSKQGYKEEADVTKADVILLNTCSIRDKSEHKVLSMLGQLLPIKQSRPDTVIGVSGCVGQRMGRQLLDRVPHLDLVFGPDSVDRVGDLVASVVNEGRRVVEARFDEMGRKYSQPLSVHKVRPAEYLTIVKGCDHFCTYCIVPFVRGREKSRPIPEIVDDVKKLVDQGTKEVTFLGQNINTYGKGTEWNLAELIEQTNAIRGLERIRYLTSHPRDLGEDLIAQFGAVEKLCPSLHLPFQSGSDRILKRMSRLYTREKYMDTIGKLKAVRPDLALSTDVIVGFPGETEEDFEQTLDVMREVGFSQSFLFKYSPRPGTRAVSLPDEIVPEPVKDERLKRLQNVLDEGLERDNAKIIGTTVKVLVDSMDKKKTYYSGRDWHNKKVHIYNAGDACYGKIIDVEITESTGTNLRGYFVGAPKTKRGQSHEAALHA